MKAVAAALAALVVVAAALFAFAPATLVDQRIAQATDGRVRIAEASGTVWHGSGRLADARGHVRIPVDWRIDPYAIVRGVVDASFASPRSPGALAGRVTVDDARVNAGDVRIVLPAVAAIALPGVDGASFGGEVALRTDSLAVEGDRAQGAVDVQWTQARGAWSGGVVDFGTVTLRLAPTATGLAGPIEARGGSLAARGTVELAAGTVRADVELVPSADAPATVRRALAQLGQPDARGAVRLVVSRTI
jgi:general secretion pathway protein N